MAGMIRAAPCIVVVATALAKLQPSRAAAVTSATAAASTGVLASSRHADAVTSDSPTADAACMRLVHGDVGGGKLKMGESRSRVRRRTQQPSPVVRAVAMSWAARPGFEALVLKYTAAVAGRRVVKQGSSCWEIVAFGQCAGVGCC